MLYILGNYFYSRIVFNENEYIACMQSAKTWQGDPELKMYADFLEQTILVLTPMDGMHLNSGAYPDIYAPSRPNRKPVLMLKKTPGHFQVIKFPLIISQLQKT